MVDLDSVVVDLIAAFVADSAELHSVVVLHLQNLVAALDLSVVGADAVVVALELFVSERKPTGVYHAAGDLPQQLEQF